MHINVRDILVESVGYNRSYKISGERPDLESVKLTRDIDGELSIARLEDSLLLRGGMSTEIELECHRCLSTFTRPIRFNVAQEYSKSPDDEQMPITEDDDIDIGALAEQEIILSTPIKVLCKPDCPGIKEAAGKYTKTEDTATRVANRARITKGTKRGRT